MPLGRVEEGLYLVAETLAEFDASGRDNMLAEAYQLMADVYGWFREGFDTADLQEAGALLEDLA